MANPSADGRAKLSIDSIDALSMRRLAELAEVSTRTLYNHYRAKDDILVALMGQTLEALDDELTQLRFDDPILRSRGLIAVANRRMVHEASVARPLLVATDRTRRDPGLIRQSREFQVRALTEAIEQGALRSDVPARLLAHQIVTAQMNAARHWAHGRLSDEAFQAQALHGWALLLLGVASDETRHRLLAELQQLEMAVGSLVDALEGRAGEDTKSEGERAA